MTSVSNHNQSCIELLSVELSEVELGLGFDNYFSACRIISQQGITTTVPVHVVMAGNYYLSMAINFIRNFQEGSKIVTVRRANI